MALIVEIERDNSRVVAADYEAEIDVGRDLVFMKVLKGFRFDGASIPRLLWPICGTPFDSPRIEAALLHDWLYAAHVTSRAQADAIFRNYQLTMPEIPWYKPVIEWVVLRFLGGAAWRSHGKADEDFALEHGAIRAEVAL